MEKKGKRTYSIPNPETEFKVTNDVDGLRNHFSQLPHMFALVVIGGGFRFIAKLVEIRLGGDPET